MREPRQIVIRPVVTEESAMLQETDRTYTFIVAKDANKIEIKNAVQSLFDVRVEGVRTAVYRGKWRRMGRSEGRRASFKKAIVKLAEGDAIDVYEGI
jgi:large subunit ribosomal protein L23